MTRGQAGFQCQWAMKTLSFQNLQTCREGIMNFVLLSQRSESLVSHSLPWKGQWKQTSSFSQSMAGLIILKGGEWGWGVGDDDTIPIRMISAKGGREKKLAQKWKLPSDNTSLSHKKKVLAANSKQNPSHWRCLPKFGWNIPPGFGEVFSEPLPRTYPMAKWKT